MSPSQNFVSLTNSIYSIVSYLQKCHVHHQSQFYLHQRNVQLVKSALLLAGQVEFGRIQLLPLGNKPDLQNLRHKSLFTLYPVLTELNHLLVTVLYRFHFRCGPFLQRTQFAQLWAAVILKLSSMSLTDQHQTTMFD